MMVAGSFAQTSYAYLVSSYGCRIVSCRVVSTRGRAYRPVIWTITDLKDAGELYEIPCNHPTTDINGL